jgi:hypothetical protein
LNGEIRRDFCAAIALFERGIDWRHVQNIQNHALAAWKTAKSAQKTPKTLAKP